MAQPNLIKIGIAGDTQELSAFGRVYVQRWEDGLTREDRAASGKLRKDVIARKRNFSISFDLADQDTVDRFNELFEIDDELILEVTHLTSTKTYTVLMSPFEQERLLAVWGGMWSGLSVEFREV